MLRNRHVKGTPVDSSRSSQRDNTHKSQNCLAVQLCVFGKHGQIAVPGPVCCFQVDICPNRCHVTQLCSRVLFGHNHNLMRWRVCRPQRREVCSRSDLRFLSCPTWLLVVEKMAVAIKQLTGKIYGVVYFLLTSFLARHC